MLKVQVYSTVKRLVLIRGLRSLGQGAMVVDLTLYLKDLRWSGAAGPFSPAEQAWLARHIDRENRGMVFSINNALPMRLPSSIGPLITGYMFDMGMTSLPLILTASLQLANAAIYQLIFGSYDKNKLKQA